MGAKIERFEDLIAWQLGREVANAIYELTRMSAVAKDFGFVDQVRRAAVSIMNNVAEGYERGSNRDFARFLFVARGSAGEVRSMLYVALDQGYIDQETFNSLSELCCKCSRTIWGLIRSLGGRMEWIEKAATAIFMAAVMIGLIKV